MALKNLNQMSTLGGGGTILNSSTNRGSEFLLRQEEEKKKAEEKRRAQIRALDELEAEAGFRNLSQNKNAPVAQNFGTVGQNKPLSAVGRNNLGLSGKVISPSVESRSNEHLKLKRAAEDTIKGWQNEYATVGNTGIDLLDEFREENTRAAEAHIKNAIANTKAGAAEIADLGVTAAKSIKGGLDFTKASGGGTKGMPTLGVPIKEHDTRTFGEKIIQNDSKAVLKDIKKDASTFAEGAEDYRKQYLTSGNTLTDKAEAEIEKVKEEYKDVLGSGAGALIGDVVGSTARQLPRLVISAIPGFGTAAATATMFATASNSAYKEALLNGATDEEAKMYSILAGAVEAGGEYAIGGVLGQGTGYLDDLWKISKKVTEPISRTALKILGSSVGEGFEEMAQSVLTTIAQKITYDPDAKVDFTELAYEGLIGALSAGLMSGANIRGQYRGAKSEIGQIQAEKALGTMSSEDILSAIDSVHETAVELGQEEQFNSALLSVYEKAYGDKASFTERLRNNAKKVLDPETEAKANSLGILSTADLSEDAKIAVAKAAAKYGIGTAGTRVTGMQTGTDLGSIGEAERLSKLTGSKVVFYDEGIVKGGIRNGFLDNDGIIHVNHQAKNPLAVVLSHELTHTLEGSSSYDDLSYIVFKTLRESGTDIGQMIDDRMTLYAKHNVSLTEEDARREIVADYVSENFMENEEQIRNIVAQDRPLAVRIREFLDRVLARFGNTDAQGRVQEYDRVREIRDAYKRALGERVTPNETTSVYSIGKTVDNEPFVTVDRDILAGVPQSEWVKVVKSNLKTKFPDGVTVGKEQINIDGSSRKELTYSGYMQWLYNNDPRTYADKLRSTDNADEILTAATDWIGEEPSHQRKDKTREFARGKVLLRIGDSDYTAEVVVGTNLDGSAILYDIVNLQPTAIKEKETGTAKSENPSPRAARNTVPFSDSSISETEPIVNNKFSISASGNTETAKQHFGTTRNWAETGYLLTDGTQLDFSGRHWGGDGGYREVDHRDINEALGEDIPGNEAMVSFMAEGNIRISPETGGINISVMPTKEQERALRSFVREYGGEVILDIDNENGVTVSSTEYPAKTSAEKVINDIRAYFETGATPVVSDLGRFRQYSISEADGETEVRDEDVLYERGMSDEDVAAQVGLEVGEVSGKYTTKTQGGKRKKGELSEFEVFEGSDSAQLTTDVSERTVAEDLPTKARDYLARTENKLLDDISKMLGVPYKAKRGVLRDIVREISETYLREGKISEESRNELFETAYDKGIIVSREYYDQYKHIKDYLRTTPVVLSERDRADIADYEDFRKKVFGTIRLLNENKNGAIPVDTAYQELCELAPELFDTSVTHPDDQLQKMYNVGVGIKIAERSLDEYFGEYSEDVKAEERKKFDEILDEVEGKLHSIRRYDEARSAEREIPYAITTVEEATAAYNTMKKIKKDYDRVKQKYLLTDEDKLQIGRLIRGQITLEDLDPKLDDIEAIKAVYPVQRDYEMMAKALRDYRQGIVNERKRLASSYLGGSIFWKDKTKLGGLRYSRETMERNVEDIVVDEKGKPDTATAAAINKEYFEPVHDAEANANRLKNRIRERVKALKLSRKTFKGDQMSEAAIVQFLMEAEENKQILGGGYGFVLTADGKDYQHVEESISEMWEANPTAAQNKEKIRHAVDEFNAIYKYLFEEINRARVENGYEPINLQSGYAPHYFEGTANSYFQHIANSLGFGKNVFGEDITAEVLPTSINGLTKNFRPGIRWFGNAQSRKPGFNTIYDAVDGIDRYIEGAASIIYQTENIGKLRAFSSEIRHNGTDEGTQEAIDKINTNEELTEEQKQLLISDINKSGTYALSNFVNELEEYTNLLANKKAGGDREVERKVGRKAYKLLKWLEQQVGANMVGANLSSALTNFIPLAQAHARLDPGSLAVGMWKTLANKWNNDGVSDTSTFLVNRRGSDKIVQTWFSRGAQIAGKPFELVDNFVSGSILRARYYENKKNGMSDQLAMSDANAFASRVMGDRSKGGAPTLFSETNPLTKVFTQFQLEVNNQFSEFTKDLPREAKKRNKALAVMLMDYFVCAWVFDEIFEAFFGRRPAVDPIEILNEFSGDLTGYQLPNMITALEGGYTADDFKTERVGAGEAIVNLGMNVLEELPFTAGLAILGVDIDGGRLPVASAIPDVATILTAATNEDWSTEKKAKEIWDEVQKPLTYLAPPFGGGQAAKTIKGLTAYAKGGSYTIDNEGRDVLQYPIYKDEPFDAAKNFITAALFGKNATQTGKEWVDSGFDSLSVKATSAYQSLLENGVSDRESFELIKALIDAEKTDTESKGTVQLGVLDNSKIPEESKQAVYYELLASENEKEKIDQLIEAGVSDQSVYYALSDFKEISATTYGENKTEEEKYRELESYIKDVGIDMSVIGKDAGERYTTSEVKRVYLDEAGISADDKAYIYRYLLAGEKEAEVFDECLERGDDAGEIYDYLYRIYTSKSQAEKMEVLGSSKISDGSKYDIYYFDYALDDEIEALDELKNSAPLGEIVETVTELRRLKKSEEKRDSLSSSPLSIYEQSVYYFSAMASKSQLEKLDGLLDGGISQVEYYDFLMNTLDISGENKKAQILSYIDGTGMTSEEKDMLYLAAGYSENTIDDAPWHSGSFGGSGIFGTSSIFGDSGIFGSNNSIFGDSGIFGEKGIFG